jgi:replicative DNA helicase
MSSVPEPASSQPLTLTELHFNLLLAQVLRSKSVAEQAFRVLEPEHLKSAGGRSAHSILFYAMKRYYTQHKTTPDDAALHIEVQDFCNQYQASRPEFVEEVMEVFTTFLDFRSRVNDKSIALTIQIVKQIADQFIHRPAINELLSTALAKESIAGIAKQLTDMEARIASSSGRSSVDGIASLDMSDAGGARVTTGIPWIDAKFGGGAGIVLGSALGIIAPQGHGKTSLGIHLGVAQALQQRHALLILAEEGLSRAIRRRIVACATGIPTPELEAAGDDVAKALGNRNPLAIKEKMAAVDKYLHVVDMVNKPIDIEAALNEITTLRLSGREVTYVYVDWAGPIATKMRSTGYKGMELRTQYDALKVLASELSLVAANTNTVIAVSHQTAGAQVKKGWNADVDQYCAMECSTFTESFKYVMVVNPREKKSGLCWLTIPKSRDDPLVTRLIVKLRGELSQFSDVTNEYNPNPSKATGFRVKNTNKPSVPTE